MLLRLEQCPHRTVRGLAVELAERGYPSRQCLNRQVQGRKAHGSLMGILDFVNDNPQPGADRVIPPVCSGSRECQKWMSTPHLKALIPLHRRDSVPTGPRSDGRPTDSLAARKRVVVGKSVSVRVDVGGRRVI